MGCLQSKAEDTRPMMIGHRERVHSYTDLWETVREQSVETGSSVRFVTSASTHDTQADLSSKEQTDFLARPTIDSLISDQQMRFSYNGYLAATNSRVETVKNLPLLCVETILKFTPTSKIIRLCSNAVPLPGAFWNLGLKTVLKKRLPLSLRDDLPYERPGHPDNAKALFDITGSKIAVVKKPHMFRFCPLREFIESATLYFQASRSNWSVEKVKESRFGQKDLLASDLKHLQRILIWTERSSCLGLETFAPASGIFSYEAFARYVLQGLGGSLPLQFPA